MNSILGVVLAWLMWAVQSISVQTFWRKVVEEDKGHTVLSSIRVGMICGGRSGGVCQPMAFGAPVWLGRIKTIKWRFNSLNGFSTKFIVTFVLNSTRNAHWIWWGRRGKVNCHERYSSQVCTWARLKKSTSARSGGLGKVMGQVGPFLFFYILVYFHFLFVIWF
jgi:hypothetical protein